MLVEASPDFTIRERQTLSLLMQGKSNTEIAETLGGSLRAAEYHVSQVLQKLDLNNGAEAAVWGWRKTNFLIQDADASWSLRWPAEGGYPEFKTAFFEKIK
jgi:DNA-binding CsgD family transcriptional regulator